MIPINLKLVIELIRILLLEAQSVDIRLSGISHPNLY